MTCAGLLRLPPRKMTSYAMPKRLLNHRDLRDVAGRYPKVDDARMSEEITLVKRLIIQTAPFVSTALI